MKPVWRIETKFDKSGNAIATYAYSYNYKTGQSHLDYSYKYDNEGNGDTEEEKGYIEYLDSLDNLRLRLFFHQYIFLLVKRQCPIGHNGRNLPYARQRLRGWT